MSINITVHGNNLDTVTRRNMFCDPERLRKEQSVERRKQRLVQVRQQSKEVAAQVRRNVDEEIKKQERRIEELKQNELLRWRAKAMSEVNDQHKKSLSAVGAAHRAALEERDSNLKAKVRQKNDEVVAAQRGKYALHKEKLKTQQKEQKQQSERDKSKKNIPKKPIRINNENSSSVANKAIALDELSASSSDEDVSLTKTIFKKQSQATLTKTKVVHMEVNADSDSSSISLQDSHEDANMHFYRLSNKSVNSIEASKRSSYNAIDYKASDNSSSDRSNPIAQPEPQPESRPSRKFTQITDLIGKRHRQSASTTTNDFQAITEQNLSNLSSSKMRPSALKNSLPLETTTSKSTTKSTSKSESSNTVQFYDYKNKFAKQYEQGRGIVLPIAKPSEMNAMDSARMELIQHEKEKKSAEQLRLKSEERAQKAIEREQIRRDCELLTKQLDSLKQDKGIMREISGKGVNVFSQKKMEQIAADKQKKMSTAFENILQGPVLITCPEIEDDKISSGDKPSKLQPASSLNVASYLERTKNYNNNVGLEDLSASDSCTSILLNYVDNQSKEISQDIEKCKSTQTVNQLKALLAKINDLRTQLLDELNKCTTKQAKDNIDMQNIAHSVSDLRKQRENILTGENKNIESIKADLKKREKRLKKKEEHIERKLKEIAQDQAEENQNAIAKQEKNDVVVVSNENAKNPIQIIIKLKGQTEQKSVKTPFKSPRKRSSLIDIRYPKRKKIVISKQKELTPEKRDKLKISERVERVVKSPNSISTSYLSPPDVIHTKLSDLLVKKPILQDEKNEPIQKRIESKVDSNKDTKLNPLLTHYIQRLLGMSRSSIDMLGVSSSTVETPSSSLINNSANASSTASDIVQKERMQRLEEYIRENYSFINEMEESIKSNKSQSSSNDSNEKTIEKIWLEALRKKVTNQEVRDCEKELKSILKKKLRPKTNKVKTKSSKHNSDEFEFIKPQSDEQKVSADAISPEQVDNSDSKKLHLVGKYTELTENCSKRIAELTEMIDKVRKEKQKILEITLTSGSETGRNSTEYKDFPDNRSNKSEDNSSKIVDAKNSLKSEDGSEKVNLEKNKLTGISRDSGISLSRPLTALDSNDAHDMRIIDRFTPEQQFEPILKDIPKLAPQISSKNLAITVRFEHEHSINKRPKPPTSMIRYSPEDIPHELSTILEVDTPATSRLNASTNEKNNSGQSTEKTNRNRVSYKSFPTYEEYAEENGIDISEHNSEANVKLNEAFLELINISGKGKLKYEEFPILHTYLHGTVQGNDSKHNHFSVQKESYLNLMYQKFPTHKTYAEIQGITGLLDTQSIEVVSISDNTSKPESIESGDSLPDVVAELKKRNILKHSFRNDEENEDNPLRSGSSSIQEKCKSPVSSSSPPMDNLKINSPVKTKEQEIRNSGGLSPRKVKNQNLTGIELLPTSSSKSTSDNIEKDLDKMGLKWASRMLKKSQQSMELSSTSSSYTYEPRRKSPKKLSVKSKTNLVENILLEDAGDITLEAREICSDLSITSIDGPLNLRAFLAKELQKRTNTSNSLSSSDDSLASLFLRSLLNSANETPKQNHNERMPQDRLRTSTPLLTPELSQSSKPSHESTKLFSGESYLSSVRLGSNTSRQNSNAGQSSTSADDLIIPNIKLNIDKSS